ncbi:hypothetical protein TCAL_11791 [Tigriopus californicus]|uniref:Spaetzle domain-containing protein n=1 Tax=Tigriopus californicus TaxID=6832 RepID=A0A553NQR7_TIGCA|nr:uncharacterized protein LOC131879856 [Tigriopus californicus]TRY67777.1 hypothetical protein TCAL_11791 [Tigriopus californicus]|eukprot:TCALIF_11791-PA protein Name:"Protein of unknown function" AED:0.02 eAED:0.02 QI:276/1/1/1/0.75/0.66/9/666/393
MLFQVVILTLISLVITEDVAQYPQGYYPFEESPAKIPPKVRKPPYLQTQINCPGVGDPLQEQTLDNLCGDLNKGFLPLNPIGQTVEGVSYPFDLFKSKTLEYFSKTLPILKADDTLPKVAKYEDNHIAYNPTIFNSQPGSRISFYHHRTRREAEDLEAVESAASFESTDHAETPRQSRGWCDDSYGVFCMLFNAFKGKNNDKATNRIGDEDIPSLSQINSLESPMTPCPSAVEYVTPVFAKNYQGVWRYVVQIPYEGYFTQTVEVVKCLSTKCEYLDGSCLASPRWVSLLVAEVYYPDTSFPNPTNPHSSRNPVQGGNPPQGFNNGHFSKKQGYQAKTTTSPDKCDGQDEMGCYQVRLYYDWFLIPGSCKCWKNDFFEQYAKGAQGQPQSRRK